MKKIIFDTNMLYNYLEIRGNTVGRGHLINIINKYDTYVTSVSLVESIVSFKHDFITIKKIIETIGEDFTFINIGLMPVEDETIYLIKNSKSLTQISNLIREIEEMKIKKEAEFSRLFFYSVLTVLSWCIIEINKEELEASGKIGGVIQHFNAALHGNLNYILEQYRGYLEKGYVEKAPQKRMKKVYEIDIKLFMRLCIALYYNVINDFSIIDMSKNNQKQLDSIFDALDTDKLLKKINIKGISNTFNGPKLKSIIDNTLNDLKEIYSDDTMFSGMEMVVDYFIRKVRKIILNGAKFKTNDISDMLILSSIYAFKEDEVILLTHDKDIKSFLKDTKNDSLEFMNSYNV
ncbi:hypothetical protein RCG17_22850 [Neobacillus sp. PS3-12]|uniref:hypothetical protein n=1 Tax=Neobacillus sp. PS3-12 TaxID=3070677 RepID=UPI0027DF935C|nr:hypothetical protein [Neobacillus sp. PS3-12]WML52199.1 hypothetical protein RCG17_22850 [Neobacillus sp. PS3-12]